MEVPRIMVFRPTWEEFKDFPAYIEYIESKGAHKAGLVKVQKPTTFPLSPYFVFVYSTRRRLPPPQIVPPAEWVPRKGGYDLRDMNLPIPSPISQEVNGMQGVYQQFNLQRKATTVQSFKELAESERYATPRHFDYNDLERKYWKNVTYIAPIYGADVSGTLTDPEVKEWNINCLGTILDYVNRDYGVSISGVNTAYLCEYIAVNRVAFCEEFA